MSMYVRVPNIESLCADGVWLNER